MTSGASAPKELALDCARVFSKDEHVFTYPIARASHVVWPARTQNQKQALAGEEKASREPPRLIFLLLVVAPKGQPAGSKEHVSWTVIQEQVGEFVHKVA